MRNKLKKLARIRSVPRHSGRFLLLSAWLFALTGVLFIVLQIIFNKGFPDARQLFPTVPAVALIALGCLLILFSKRNGLFWLPAVVLSVAMILYAEWDVGLLPCFAGVVTLLAAVGMRVNVTFTVLPKRLHLPLLSLISGAAALLSAVAVAGQAKGVFAGFRLYLLSGNKPVHTVAATLMVIILTALMLLPLAATVLLTLSMTPQTAEKRTASQFRTKAVPNGNGAFTAASRLLLIAGVAELLTVLLGSYSLRAVLSMQPLIAAALLLLHCGGREKRYFAAVVLLTVYWLLLVPIYSGWRFIGYMLPLVAMIISARGVSWNIVPKFLPRPFRAPVLNLAAALFLLRNTYGAARNLGNTLKTIFSALKTLPSKGFSSYWSSPARPPILPALLLLFILVGLVILNLSSRGKAVERKQSAGALRRTFNRLTGRFYGNVGGKLQALAKTVIGGIGTVLFCLSAVAVGLGMLGTLNSYFTFGYFDEFIPLLGAGAAGLVASLILIVSTWPLYAFGQITSDVREVKAGGGTLGGECSEPNPDGLPELRNDDCE
ncbi:MAG: hypothetical protein LBT12_04575 [Oscillospiraceae bacterium]|jgi:hypothetical protein|nr:hypothetical protein [Oscillospiraceae bacterium]